MDDDIMEALAAALVVEADVDAAVHKVQEAADIWRNAYYRAYVDKRTRNRDLSEGACAASRYEMDRLTEAKDRAYERLSSARRRVVHALPDWLRDAVIGAQHTRTFSLWRDEDVTGFSGTGIVADGVEFDDGAVVLHWRGKFASTTIFGDMATLKSIHGHGGKTRVIYSDGEEA